MTIHYFTIQNGIISAGVKIDGKRYILPVWSQNDHYYVTTGSKVNKDLKRYDFSENQEKLFKAFDELNLQDMEFFEGV